MRCMLVNESTSGVCTEAVPLVNILRLLSTLMVNEDCSMIRLESSMVGISVIANPVCTVPGIKAPEVATPEVGTTEAGDACLT